MSKEIGPREKQLRELAEARAAARAKPNSLAKRPVGRPKVEGPRPWDIEGISKRTWHRRQAEKAGK